MQDKWKVALEKFLKKWENKKEVTGILVCGSYVTGNPSKHSDIDIHILLDSKTTRRERGNEIIDGFLIEYFANSTKRHHQYLEEDLKSRHKINAHMFCTGEILLDKTGELKRLVQYSQKYLKKKNPKLNKMQIEIAKYHIWDMCDNLEEVFDSNTEEFYLVFYNFLNKLFETYAQFLQFDTVPIDKLRRFLVNEQDKKKYLVSDFPDKKFTKMIVSAINIKDKTKMMEEFKTITKYTLKKMGGFNIDGWKIKSPA
ncbi:MAG TPA: nucleotidyltransferase domain-containing protein [Candidatus Absconditabacterales bacterium]|nr:nucleotidyltransferase domain-containing protein [Candidatus Absconditabacterales bacterium]HPK28111.1 nucleotidyltransferase domain-containing protein [Candidatus Absconditabacterales bacterium]